MAASATVLEALRETAGVDITSCKACAAGRYMTFKLWGLQQHTCYARTRRKG